MIITEQDKFIAAAFASAAGLAYFVSLTLFRNPGDDKLRSRLQGKASNDAAAAPEKKAENTGVAPILSQIGQAAAKPFMPTTREKQSAMRRQLGYAGIYSPSAIKAIQGGKVILMVVGVIAGYALGMATHKLFLFLALGGLFGYMVPTIFLRLRVRSNQKGLEYALPDALDLMVVCVEAGLTVDAAMQRVGEELALVHPALSREFGISHMETRVGLPRQEALKNLGLRTGNQALTSLAAMLNQADRFGTSIAQALRIHAESMRIKRQHKAEEMASKSAVKMSFPLVLFIFPATFIVLMGPVIINLMHSDLMK